MDEMERISTVLNQIKIPRWYGYDDQNTNNTELHVFSEPSSIAYGTVSHMPVESKGNVICCFITGKSILGAKDAKSLTAPGLKFLAALSASRMKMTLVKEITIKFNKIRLRTDCKVVLNHLKNTCSNFDNYILHQTSKIRTHTNFAD